MEEQNISRLEAIHRAALRIDELVEQILADLPRLTAIFQYGFDQTSIGIIC